MQEELKFRRQFLLSSKELSFPDSWNINSFNQGNLVLNLYSHPDLSVAVVKKEKIRLILLGYMLDIYNPQSSNEEILENLSNLKNFDSIVKASSDINGRYVLSTLMNRM